MFGQNPPAGDVANMFNAKLIVIWGTNPPTSQWVPHGYVISLAREQGIPVILLESRYTETAEALADQWIPIRPTTDVALAMAIANVWFKENLIDQNFVGNWVEPTGLAKWKDYVLGNSAGLDGAIDRTPQWAQAICGVPAQTITDLAHLWINNKPVYLIAYAAPCRQFFGENAARAINYLLALSGSMLAPGTNTFGEPGAGGKSPLSCPAVNWNQAKATYSAPVRFFAPKWAQCVNLRAQYRQRPDNHGSIQQCDW